jgi:putative SOS response-associated peptidase YedK
MCGRFTRQFTWAQLHALYSLSPGGSNLQPRYNIAPTTTIDTVVEQDGTRALVPMRWGLIPGWWNKTAKEVPATFNARSDTVETKPMFRNAFKKRRCLIPMSGYYEWVKAPDGKQPFYFCAKDDNLLTAAGLWDEWMDPQSGEPVKSATMIITESNAFVNHWHDRMPVLLDRENFDGWLRGEKGAELFKPANDDKLQAWPVSRRVNKTGAGDDDPTTIDKMEPNPA